MEVEDVGWKDEGRRMEGRKYGSRGRRMEGRKYGSRGRRMEGRRPKDGRTEVWK
jgi:hypothetical protein